MKRRRGSGEPRGAGVAYDTGALLAAESEREAVWAFHRRTLERGVHPVVPAPVLAQAWRGGPQPAMSRLLKGCDVVPLSESDARDVGSLLARSGTGDVVDAAVVLAAVRGGRAVVTSDPKDLHSLADAQGSDLALHVV
jgi:hypothetical protein